MNKSEFLNKFRHSLHGLPHKDMQGFLDYYGEMIDDRIEAGMSEEEAVADLGDPAKLAREALVDLPLPKMLKSIYSKRRTMSAWEIALLVLGSPLWISLLLVAVIFILAVYIVLWSLMVSLWAVAVSLVGTAVGGVFVFGTTIASNAQSALVYLGVGLLGTGISIPMLFGCFRLTRLVIKLSIRIMRSVKYLIIGRKEKRERKKKECTE